MFGIKEVSFLGHLPSAEGIRLDPQRIPAVQNMETPTNVSDVRSVLGMANDLGRFLPNIAQKTVPLWELLKTSTEWAWGPAQETAWKELKSMICSSKCMAKYNSRQLTILLADASSFGLGAVLVQEQPTGERRPIAFA